MNEQRIDQPTGNIWEKDATGRMIMVGNVMDRKDVVSQDKISEHMTQKEGLMQSCCNEYNNVHPISWRDGDGKWHLAWRCEICQRTMDLTINAKSTFVYIVGGNPITLPRNAIIIEHTKPDIQQIRSLENGADVYRAEREKAVPNDLLFEGACPNCAYQPLSGKAKADQSIVYKCTTCDTVYKIMETGKYCKYFGNTDLDPEEEVTPPVEIAPETPAVENLTTVEGNVMPAAINGQQMIQPEAPVATSPIASIDEMFDIKPAPVVQQPVSYTQHTAVAPDIEDIDLNAAMTARVPLSILKDIVIEENNSMGINTASAEAIINTGNALLTHVSATIFSPIEDSPVTFSKTSDATVYGHTTKVGVLYNYVLSAEEILIATVAPNYHNEPATFLVVVVEVNTGDTAEEVKLIYRSFIQVHPSVDINLLTGSMRGPNIDN